MVKKSPLVTYNHDWLCQSSLKNLFASEWLQPVPSDGLYIIFRGEVTKYRWLLLTKTIGVTVNTSPTVLLFLLANYTLVSLVNGVDFYHISSEFILTTLSCSFVSRVQSFRCYTFSSLLAQRGKIFSSLLLKKQMKYLSVSSWVWFFIRSDTVYSQ